MTTPDPVAPAEGLSLVQIGMRAAVRDVVEWIDGNDRRHREIGTIVDSGALRAYLLAMLITAGAYDEAPDGQG